MKKFITGILIASMIMMPMTSFASSGADILTVEQATEEMLENNDQFDIQKIKIEQAEDDYDSTIGDINAIDERMIREYGSTTAKAMVSVQKEVGKLKAEYAKDMAYISEKSTKEKMKTTLKEVYYKLIELRQSIEQTEKSFLNLLEQEKIVKTKLGLGSATQLELNKIHTNVLEMSSQINALKELEISTVMKFNQILGREDLAQKINLDTSINVLKFDKKLRDVTEYAIENQQAFDNIKREKEFVMLEGDIYKRKLPVGYEKRERAARNRDIAELDLKKAEKDLKIQVYEKYYEVKKLQRELVIVDEKKKNAEKDLEIAKIKLDTGMITQLQYADAENNLLKAKIDQIKKIQEHNLKIEQFEYFINIGL